MAIAIEKSIEVIEDIGELVIDIMALVRQGVGLGSLGRLLEVVSDLRELAEDVPDALPELADVDAKECERLASAAYAQLKKIVAAGL